MRFVHRPTETDIDRASMRIAAVTLYPTFAGGVYEFTRDDLSCGEWRPAEPQRPLIDGLAVYVPPLDMDPFPLRQARCRVLIEDALRDRGARPGELGR
jgi:hypothetical protein